MRAFSLIELLVVVAIIAVLAAVALPIYKSYKIRLQVIAASSYMQPLLDAAKRYYALNGNFPVAATALPTTCSSYSSVYAANDVCTITVNSSSILTAAVWSFNAGGTSTTHQSYFGAIGFQPNVGFDSIAGTSAGLYFVLNADATSGTIKTYCGVWDPTVSGQSIPASLMPPNCTQTNISHTFS